ncbi:UDP-N-acetylmuramoyl-L-alanine--D-glutamate ligase [Gracilimonas mengyeensis]|uniref:UDP-N-acetylmuramoylalanine--D-glutamate ligase n=1 Tax=Gracilimonas mengyeensis TaxID=1302730 RepID=A0A521E1L0_9BACT|nr:UDP-N-acetylmuramoyl-L-alanine--D-glutamate ligase [Gracilimonas mengyeensis]SMO77725.1 UDP-N-acetylmuramoylalanine--D-glutamate ligase [Gracilimonas mengyeensis]
MTEVQEKHIVVIGAARSGVAAALLLQKKGADVFVSDYNAIGDEAKQKMEAAGIPFEENGHTEKARKGDFAVVSPGVPTEAPIVQYYLNESKRVYSEIEVASWFTSQDIIAVTGSNGKTTVANWLHHVWNTAKRDHALAGNIGMAFSDEIESNKGDFLLEVSSFQLDHINDFKPAISLILNITPDHLNRYQNSLEAYAAAKFRITENQTADERFIFNYDDPIIQKHVEQLTLKQNAPQLWGFSYEREVPQGAFVRDQHIIFKFNDKEEPLMPVEELGLRGRHNLSNGLATALAARAAEIKNEAIRESLRSFTGVEHRLELAREVEGVKYINDSKATNVNAVWFALDSFNVPVTLILGGRDKGNDYSELEAQIREKVHTIIAIGESKERVEEQLGKTAPNFVKVETMGGAVRAAQRGAKRGEVVLLSPACASFDMFDSYEHRGKIFKDEVDKL